MPTDELARLQATMELGAAYLHDVENVLGIAFVIDTARGLHDAVSIAEHAIRTEHGELRYEDQIDYSDLEDAIEAWERKYSIAVIRGVA